MGDVGVDEREEARLNALLVRRWVRALRAAWSENDTERMVKLMHRAEAVERRAHDVVGALSAEDGEGGA